MGVPSDAVGIGVSPGLGCGELHVDLDAALDAIDAGRPVVLALRTSSPGDVPVMAAAHAIIAVHGDAASHTAIVAKAAGVPAVVGVERLRVTDAGIEIDGMAVEVGRSVTVDGDRGTIRWGDA